MKCVTVAAIASVLALIPTSHAQCPNLIWSDEFDGTELNETNWSHMVGDGCDMGEGMCGWGNNEWQYYTQGTANAQVSNGTLKITAKYDPNKNQYTSARIRSLGKADFDLTQNLRMEARLKVPKNSIGLWPAFWMMPSQIKLNKWPQGGEIDIFEFIGKEPNQTYGVFHYGNKWNDKSQKGGLLKFPEHAGNDFHVFAVEKRKHKMTWFLDGKQYLQFTKNDIEPKFEWPFEAVFHFIINMAVAGNWPGPPDDTTLFPNTLEVDYVRVYDLDSSPEPTPQIIGDSLVRTQAQDIQYCVTVGSLEPHTDYDTFLEWTVPVDAAYTRVTSTESNCILVNFGKHSGAVQANVYFNCGEEYEFKLPVEVQDFYGAEFSLLSPDPTVDQAAYDLSTGTFNVVVDTNDDSDLPVPTIVYQRNQLEVYDYIYLSTSAIPNPNLYVQAAKKFYMDALSPTAAPCTRFWIQLEDSSVANPSNYPSGRHSRYLALLDKDTDWQRLEFDFYDQPDATTQTVDRIVLLVDAFVQRSDTYYLRNLVSAVAGCDAALGRCEPLSTNTCQAPAKSEAGACTDGFNNDGLGWNGDGPMDCDDSDCWGLDPACPVTDPVPPTILPPPVEVCFDGVDNDGNGLVDCEDEACADHIACGSWSQPKCTSYPACVLEGHVGDCCPNALGEYKPCCSGETPASCSVHPSCAVQGLLEGECCPDLNGNFASCCSPDLCVSNPKCSGLEGACCPTLDGKFLACCEDRPETCQIHPQCSEQGLSGECCPTPDGVFDECCEPRECAAHAGCSDLAGECCPTADGVYLDCCSLDLPVFEGFTGRVVQSQMLEAVPTSLTKGTSQSESEAKRASLSGFSSHAPETMGWSSTWFLTGLVIYWGVGVFFFKLW